MAGILFRRATRADVPAIVRLLAEDDLGSQRERFADPLTESYFLAFEQIDRDANHELIVAEQNGDVIGTLHLIFLPSLSYQGGTRAQVESVRVDQRLRNQGIGRGMMLWAIERVRQRGCPLLQLTSNKSRADAHGFYISLGFTNSHTGMKLNLK